MDPAANTSDSRPSRATRDAVAVWQSGVDAANGRKLVSNFVQTDSDGLTFGDFHISTSQFRRVCVLGAGKAALPMSLGLLDSFGNTDLATSDRMLGQLNLADDGAFDDNSRLHLQRVGINACLVRPHDCNLPTPQAVRATLDARNMAASLEPDDILVVLLSGGGSSLLVAPREPVSLDDQLQLIELLSASAADIRELNTLRAVTSQVKQGGLIRDCASQHIITLIVSDIIGDPIELIAGGPTCPAPLDLAAAREIAQRYDPDQSRLPASCWQLLSETSDVPVHRIANDLRCIKHFVLGNIETAVDGAAEHARALGYHVTSETTTERQTAEQAGIGLQERLQVAPRGTCLISGGEPVVRLASLEFRGQGGRNQQLVLAALIRSLRDRPMPGGDWCLLSGGTDGQDGTTQAAGAWIDPAILELAACIQPDPETFLDTNNAWQLFRQTGSLLLTGPTRTNVCDLRVALIAN